MTNVFVSSVDCFSILVCLESDMIIWSMSIAIFIDPEQSQEWSIMPLFSLTFPAQFENLFHDLIRNPFWYIRSCFLSKSWNQVAAARLTLTVHCNFLEDINDPFVITGRDVNLVFSQFIYLLLGDLIDFIFKAPAFFTRVLSEVIYFFDIFNVVSWNFWACWI